MIEHRTTYGILNGVLGVVLALKRKESSLACTPLSKVWDLRAEKFPFYGIEYMTSAVQNSLRVKKNVFMDVQVKVEFACFKFKWDDLI